MTEHVCKWGLSYDYSTQNGLELYFFCEIDMECLDRLITTDQLAAIYTEYDKLKRATEVLSAEDARSIWVAGNYRPEREMLNAYADTLEGK